MVSECGLPCDSSMLSGRDMCAVCLGSTKEGPLREPFPEMIQGNHFLSAIIENAGLHLNLKLLAFNPTTVLCDAVIQMAQN